jgi:hypothetical protein
VLQETFSGLAAAWNAPRRLDVYIGASPYGDSEDATSPQMSNKENVGPGGNSVRKMLKVGLLEDEVETQVGDEPSPFCCSSSPASGVQSPMADESCTTRSIPENFLTQNWNAKTRHKRPSLSDWYLDVPEASKS